MTAYLLVNFGGPRNLEEIPLFLTTLLTDPDVIKSKIPFLFRAIAKKRAKLVALDYREIGGKSPIFEETERLAALLEKRLQAKVFTFHRYLPTTHQETIKKINLFEGERLLVFPLFPQFSYTTTGSCARFFHKHLNKNCLKKMEWIRSYPNHPAFCTLWQETIRKKMHEVECAEEDSFFLYSAHGLPQSYVERGDFYPKECLLSKERIHRAFPKAVSLLSFQSEFGKAPWVKPSTKKVCQQIGDYAQGRSNVFVIPLSFTSDHIETLFEIEKGYLPDINRQGFNSYRVPTLQDHPGWVEAITTIMHEAVPVPTQTLFC